MQRGKTTIIRKIDELGRLVLPKDIRKQMDIHNGDLLELSCTQESLSIKKYSSIREIVFLAEILLNSIYEHYHIEGLLLEDYEIIQYPTTLSKKKLEKKLKDEECISIPIVLDEKEAGRLVFFSKEEQSRDLLSFATLFLKKYLEEC